jgi:hypothetical protein
MDDSVSGPPRPGQSPSGPRQSRAVTLSVVIDGRLDAMRARQVAILVDRLDLAGVWVRRPWWPGTGPVRSDADSASLVGWLAGSAPVRAGLIGPGPVITELAPPVAGRGTGLATAVFVPCSPGRDLAAEVTTAAAGAAGRPVLVEVPVSVGRTVAEARARADADELFARTGHPAEQGLFGTLEECQAAAARLAHAGASELLCYLPLAGDLPDILAQLRSIAIGASVLRPDEPPSAAPPPPDGWGGRRATA